MPTRKAELVGAWLVKADHDLENARLLILEKRRLLDVAVYHCQQAAEKAIKAYLTAQDTVFPKTHALGELLNLCIPTQGDFEQFREHAEVLTPLAHEFRYPGDLTDPTQEEADQALHLAEAVCAYCRRQVD